MKSKQYQTLLKNVLDKTLFTKMDARLNRWLAGKPITPPPPAVKAQIIADYAKKFSTGIFIETGTYLGETIDALKDQFKKIISIELDKDLYQKALDKFKKYPQISILNGDSSAVLPSILDSLTQPALFWLDGHYSGGITAKGELSTPIQKELNAILNHCIKNHVILIDDARCFTGQNDYPTIKELLSLMFKINNKLNFNIKNDVIRIIPGNNENNSARDFNFDKYRQPWRQQVGLLYYRFKKLVKKLLRYKAGQNNH